jgi:hypothetical protein
MKKLCMMVLAPFILLGLLTTPAVSQSRIVQTYSQWETRQSAPVELEDGVSLTLTYQECTFIARDGAGKILRKDVCRYFVNDPRPQDGITEACNHWVYWLRVDQDPAKPVVWARCPSPKHPENKLLTHSLGPDLWEDIPQDKRKPNPTLQSLAESYGETFAAKPGGAPFVDPQVKVTINCIDFKNEVFR